MALLSACEGFPIQLPWGADVLSTATPSAGELDNLTPTPDLIQTATSTPEPVTELTLWVPPEMGPEGDKAASDILLAQLQQFSDLHDGMTVNVRVKAASGPGGLLDALTATSAAAPEALPDLIVLSRSDLETAALKALIYPLDGLTSTPDDADWYTFARDMALLQGSTFGVPFAADALTLVYRPAAFPEFPTTWTSLTKKTATLAFPLDSVQALFPLSLYEAAGGAVQDNQRRPILEVEPLQDVLKVMQEGTSEGIFPGWLNQFQTHGQVWTAFREGQTNLGVTWLSNYLWELPPDTAAVPLLPMDETALTLGTGLSLAIATPDTNRHAAAVALAEFLTEPEFMAAWTSAAGYIPPRPSALELWENQSLRHTISQTALMMQMIPANDVLISIGPILQESVRQVVQEQMDPLQAAQAAVDRLESQP